LGVAASNTACAQGETDREGATVPSFTVRTETGKVIRVEDYRGKVLLLAFWATWCPHCRRQIAAMERLREDYAKRGIEMLALSVDQEGWQKVSPYLEENKITMSVALADARIQRQYGVSGGIPLSYVIDRKGYAVKDFRGALDEETLRRLGEVIERNL
jgi:peroxiredoxin